MYLQLSTQILFLIAQQFLKICHYRIQRNAASVLPCTYFHTSNVTILSTTAVNSKTCTYRMQRLSQDLTKFGSLIFLLVREMPVTNKGTASPRNNKTTKGDGFIN